MNMPERPKIETGTASPEDRTEELKKSIEHARELLGHENFFGPEDVEKALGFLPDIKNIPPISFTNEELERAHKNGEHLVLRIDNLPDGKPATLENLMAHLEKQGKRVFAGDPEDVKKDVAGNDMEFFTREPLMAKWVLTQIKEVDRTRHLSYEAQKAFIEKDLDELRGAIEMIPQAWDEAGIPEEVRPELPSVEDLKKIREELPHGVSLPSAAEVVYDLLLRQARGEYALNNMAVATRSRVQEMPDIEEPERPIDIGLNGADGINFHWRRSMQFGRPGETKPGAIPGIPIGYIQREAGAPERAFVDRAAEAQERAKREVQGEERKAEDERKIAEIKMSLGI